MGGPTRPVVAVVGFGLCEDALEEWISCAQSAVDFAPRIQCRVDGPLQAIRGRLESRKELTVGERVTDDQEIDIAGHGVRGLCDGAKDERELYLSSQWREGRSQDIDEAGRLQHQTPQLLKDWRCCIGLIMLLIADSRDGH